MEKIVTSDQETQLFAARLAHALQGGETIELVGDVGAGKTTFVKGLAEGLGAEGEVQSPSYTINRLYHTTDGRRLSHYDFYRLHDPGILRDEIAEAIADPRTIVVIEWAQSVADVLPGDRVRVVIEPLSDTERRLKVTAPGYITEKLV